MFFFFLEGCGSVTRTQADKVPEQRGALGRRSGEDASPAGRTQAGGWGPQLLLHCLTSSGNQPEATATNGGRTLATLPLSLAPSLSIPHSQGSHSASRLDVDA